jgi:hypothetical protein
MRRFEGYPPLVIANLHKIDMIYWKRKCLVVIDNQSLLAHVDTVQELSDILVLDLGDLLDLRAVDAEVLNAVALEDDFVLDLRAVNGDSLDHLHSADDLLSQEVADLDQVLGVRDVNVDGEMRVDELHLVLEALGDTNHHVLDVGDNGSLHSVLLGSSKPHLDGDLLRSLISVDISRDGFEAAGQRSAGALHGDGTGGDGNILH